MKKILMLFALLTLTAVLARADRADMDRLMTDIENHNTHLAQLVTAQDAAAIKKSAASLREDAKSLGRKSTGLSERQNTQLQQRITDLSELMEKLEQAADKKDFAAAQAHYQSLQPRIEHLRRLMAVQPSTERAAAAAEAAAAETASGLTDLKNHAHKLEEAIRTMDEAQVKVSTGFIREDLKAWMGTHASVDEKERKRLTASQSEITVLAGKIEKNVAKGEWGDAREFARKLEKLVIGLDATAAAKKKRE